MKIGVVSLGCSKNLVDSENIMGLLKSAGVEITSKPKDADAIIINTCGFINSAKEEGIDTILEMAEYKKDKCKYLIVCGCLSQRYKQELMKEMPEVDRFIAIDEYKDIHIILAQLLGIKICNTYGKAQRLISSKPWTAYLKIAEGCSNQCTYCAIPLIRGKNVSVDMPTLINEAKQLASNGVKELVLIAQDTTKYGLDLYGEYKLVELLKQLNDIDDLHWIRILYMYPDEISKELISEMSKLSKVLPYFDIPLQHANNKMLKLMNRRGTIESIKETISLIKDTYEDPTLRTTFIVGFPYELDQDFNDIKEFITQFRWNHLGCFAYSKEEDTPAYNMPEQIDTSIANKRAQEIMLLQKELALDNNRKYIGKDIEVLIESYDTIKKIYRGRSKHSAPDGIDGLVFVKTKRDIQLGTFIKTTVTNALAYDLICEEL